MHLDYRTCVRLLRVLCCLLLRLLLELQEVNLVVDTPVAIDVATVVVVGELRLRFRTLR